MVGRIILLTHPKQYPVWFFRRRSLGKNITSDITETPQRGNVSFTGICIIILFEIKWFLWKQKELFQKINTPNESVINSSLMLVILIVTTTKYSTEEQLIRKCLAQLDICSEEVREFRNICQTVGRNCSIVGENSSYLQAVEGLWLR